MTDRDYWTLEAMRKWGGGFVRLLAELAWHADQENYEKVKATWPEYWAQYEEDGKELEQERGKDIYPKNV